MAVYATIHSSNHAGQSTPGRTKHGFFPTTSRISRKHSPCPITTPRYQTLLRHGNYSQLPPRSLPSRQSAGTAAKICHFHPILAAAKHLFSGNCICILLSTQNSALSMEPTHLSNTALHPTMENERGIWSVAAGFGEFGDDKMIFHFHHSYHFHRCHRIHRLRRQPRQAFGFHSVLCTLHLFSLNPVLASES
jgi:hypothetical protein